MNPTKSAAVEASEPKANMASEVLASKAPRFSGFVLAMIANILWGTSFLASKNTLEVWGPFTASALRFAVALVVMAVALPLAGFSLRIPKNRPDIIGIVLVGISGFGLLYPLQLSGLSVISSGLSAAIMLTSPLFVIALSALILRESISIRKIFAVSLGLIGGCVLLLSGGVAVIKTGSNVILGSLLTLGASACLAFSVIATRKISGQINSANITFWSMLFGFILLLPFSGYELVHREPFTPTPLSIVSLLYLAIICSAVCFLVWNRAIVRSSPKELATTMHIKTPTAVVLGVLFAGETLSLSMIVGTLIVGLGVWLSQSEQARKK